MKAIAHVKVAELTNGFERAKKLGFLEPTKRFYKNFSVILLSNQIIIRKRVTFCID